VPNVPLLFMHETSIYKVFSLFVSFRFEELLGIEHGNGKEMNVLQMLAHL
jgi:hypothetical protein